MRRTLRSTPQVLVIATLACLSAGVVADGQAPRTPTPSNVVYDPLLYQALRYRMIGPHRGSRSTAVAGVPSQRETFYMAPAAGGVWKTTDGGETWVNVSDEYFKAGSVGAIAVADSDHNVVYVGTGSACIRGNVSPGIGMYKSTDAGRSWQHIGLDDAGQIARVRVHPSNADVAYVAALGHAFGPNKERGVFRTKDGGKTWEKLLFVNERTGAVDLSMDATNPRILYAAMWSAERKPWTFTSGSADGGLYKTTDGGDTWTQVKNGLPQGIVGRIGVAVSPANANRVWAIVEAEDGGVFRSEDAGGTWQRVNDDRELQARPWYYMHIFADPRDENAVYVGSSHFMKSTDGGRSFAPIAVPHGDQHDLWLNPNDPNVMIEANDGGAQVSFNGGRSWSTQLNQPTAEIYRVAVDNQFPYRVYGSQQDQYEAMSLPSRSANFGAKLHPQNWHGVGGFEGGDVAVNPKDPNIVYSGGVGRLTRYDHRSRYIQEIKPYPEIGGTAAKNLRYRYQWTAPIRVSPHDPNVLYTTSQVVHKSTDGGYSFQVISPDLTTNDPSKQGYSGGPITRDQTTVEIYCTIFAFEESPHQQGLLWAGTDDGLVHVSRDGGGRWENVTPKGMPQSATVNMIELSPHDPGRAFLAVQRYRMDDFKPYIFRTTDYGKTWTLLTSGTNGIPANHFVRAVREDPDHKGLLYAGTEFGMYVSFDDGSHWQSLQLNLPVVPVTDLRVHRKDLVLATNGRSFWILDDLTPLHQLSDRLTTAPAYLFRPRDAYRVQTSEEEASQAYVAGTEYVSNLRDMFGVARIDRHRLGTDAPDGTTIYTYFAKEPQGDVTLEILDGGGKVVRSFRSADAAKDASLVARPESPWLKPASTFWKAGLNRFVWNLRYPGVPGNALGPRALPGTYQVRVTSRDWTQMHSFRVLPDPRTNVTDADLQQQFTLLLQIHETIGTVAQAASDLREVRGQIADLVGRMAPSGHGPEVKKAADPLLEKLSSVENVLVPTDRDHLMKNLDAPPKLIAEYRALYAYVASADAKPTTGAAARFHDLKLRLTEQLTAAAQALETDLRAFNAMLRDRGIPSVIVPSRRSATVTSEQP
ncbi:MAG: glycosyl hydrolase [Acidobacteria bacterium]|nr:glycosyl hydrolase [Acidobacteriota bacterium]